MHQEDTRRNPRYISTPTLMVSLVCAHVLQNLTAPLELGPLSASLVYLIGLLTPIVIKRVLLSDTLFEGFQENDQTVPRLPTSRFETVPGRPSQYRERALAPIDA